MSDNNKPIQIVETISIFRMRYAIRTDNQDIASELVLSDKVDNEMSQKHIAENITSVREVSEEEYIKLFDEDNPWAEFWTHERKLKEMFETEDKREFS